MFAQFRSARKLVLSVPRRHFAFGYTTLYANTNQAQGLAEFAIDFMEKDPTKIDDAVWDRVRLFHTDSVLCGISALALRTNAPTILRKEAIRQYSVEPSRSHHE